MSTNILIPKSFPPKAIHTIFSFFPRLDSLKIASNSKFLQEILNISPHEYSLIKSLWSLTPSKSFNFLRYYNFFCQEYPNISPTIIKEYFYAYVRKLSQNNIRITLHSQHPLTEELICKIAVNQNIYLQVDSNHFVKDGFNIGNATSVYKVSVSRNAKISSIEEVNSFFNQVVPKNIKKLKFYTFQDLNENNSDKIFGEHLCKLHELIRFKTDSLNNYNDQTGKLLKSSTTLKHIEFNGGAEDSIINGIKEVATRNKNFDRMEFILDSNAFKISEMLDLLDDNTKQRIKKFIFMDVNYDNDINFGKYTSLEKIHLRFCNMSPNIESLNCTQLKYVKLFRIEYSYKFLIDIIKSNTNLEFISFSVGDIQNCDDDPTFDKIFNEINKLPQLKKIELIMKDFNNVKLINSSLNDFSIETQTAFNVSNLITSCPNISSIYICFLPEYSYYESKEISHFNFPSSCPTLKNITIVNFKLPLNIFNCFYNYINLETLRLHCKISQCENINIPSISKLTHIKNFQISAKFDSNEASTNFWKDVSSNLQNIPYLETITIPTMPQGIDKQFIEDFCKILPKMHFLYNINYEVSTPNIEQLQILNDNISNFQNIETISINFKQSNSPVLQTFKEKFLRFFEGIV